MKNTITSQNLIHLAIYIIVGVLVLNRGAIYFPDSYTFLDMAFNHSPFYCFFLKVITSVFGDYFEIPLVIIQYLIIVFGIDFFVKILKKVFNIHAFGVIIIQLICLAPCIYLHNLGSAILSEALTYPIFLLIFAFSLKLFVEENLRYLYKICVLLSILILTRGQFLALIPVLILIVGYVIYKTKSFKKHYYFIILLAIIPIITTISERVYNKVIFGHFVNNAMNYVHIIASPFYIANETDVSLFTEEDESVYFNMIYKSLKDAELTRNQNLSLDKDDYLFFQHNFPEICNRRIYDLGLNSYEAKGLNFIEQNIALNALCSRMVFPLIKQNFKVWIKLFIKNLKNSFGSSKQILFYLVLLLYGLINLIKSNKNIYKFLVLTILFMFANNTLIALVIHSIKRYIFYFDWVVFATFIILLNKIFKYQQQRES
ncbi:hypothetical protein DIS18_14120 [Algibacter marinivivus]|uniref:Glycosyltransferase RgtA/B/C/D-like domain-containing protein n=1 Tax=Algibacter marinivivus TaxID=2100723 RepID=A0A2U2X231_9FLAO|nr:hypothetical protein [Algibacter marinivivus]PWH81809.1 hypothetical protein DIS18_14120 [Algibacter marinivivus]